MSLQRTSDNVSPFQAFSEIRDGIKTWQEKGCQQHTRQTEIGNTI